METFQHCRDKCLHSVVSDTTNLGVYRYPTHMTISVFPPIDAHFFFQGQLMASTSRQTVSSVEQAPLIVTQSALPHQWMLRIPSSTR